MMRPGRLHWRDIVSDSGNRVSWLYQYAVRSGGGALQYDRTRDTGDLPLVSTIEEKTYKKYNINRV